MRPRNKFGFTLVELLITAAVLGIISLALVATFASGLKVYEKVRSYMGIRPDVLLALERLERDLRNIVKATTIDFTGEKEAVSFAALTAEGKPGRILYYLKGRYDTLTREEQDYPRASASRLRKGKGEIKELVPLRDIDFSYYYYDSEDKEYKWKDFWKVRDDDEEEEEAPEMKRLPLGVRTCVTFREQGRDIALTRTVLIPVGYRGPLVKE